MIPIWACAPFEAWRRTTAETLLVTRVNVYLILQHVCKPLHINGLILLVNLFQSISHNAQVSTKFGDESCYFLSIAENIDTLRVRVVPDTERSLDRGGKCP